MVLPLLDELLEPVREKIDEMSFSEFIRTARMILGIKQYKVAEMMGVHFSRVKNLETGSFRERPTAAEVLALARLYGVDEKILANKVKDHVHKCRSSLGVYDEMRKQQKMQ